MPVAEAGGSAAVVRHRFDHTGIKPGTHLLFCTSAWDLAVGYADFVQHSGLRDDQLYSNPVVATPLPRYDGGDGAAASARSWTGVAAQALWHPVFWLPTSISARRIDADGYVEPEPVWAVRICLELQAAGWYEPERGWRDVLAEHGILTERSADLARVTDWLDGGADPELDSIDLADRFEHREPDGVDAAAVAPSAWAAEIAAGITANVQGRAWASIADELIGLIAAVPDDPDSVRQQTRTVLDLAQATLLDVDVPAVTGPVEFWSQLSALVDDGELDTPALRSGPLAQAQTWLTAVRSHYRLNIDVLNLMAESATDPGDASTRAPAYDLSESR